MLTSADLVSAAWLATHLGNPDLVVVDCRFSLADPEAGRHQYGQGHIPGAWYLHLNEDLSGPVQAHGGRHPLPDWEAFKGVMASIGVSSHSPTQVVVYDDSRFAFASRLWWMLNYLGHGAVAVLDGGWSGWQQGGYPITMDRPVAQAGTFLPQPQMGWTLTRDEVRRRKDEPGLRLIDSRSPERYRGEVEPIDPVAGSIPGAINYFWQAVSTAAGQMRSPADLADHWASLDSADDVIIYCGSGVTACVNLLSRKLAGKPMGKLYVGGWSDWCSYGVNLDAAAPE